MSDGNYAGYRRVSRVGDRSDTLISPEQQAERIEAYAKMRGLNVEMLEPELDVSGGKVSRPILDEVLVGIEERRFDGIIVATLDRLSRMDITDALATIRRIENAGGKVIAVAENFDDATPEGRLARNMFLSIAQMQRDRYAAQFDSAKAQAVKRGIWPGSVVPYGYSCTRVREGGTGKLEVVEHEAEIVREAFKARAKGASWQQVGDMLGKSRSGALRVLRNRTYLGEIHLRPFPPNLEAHPPIVTQDVFDAAQVKNRRPPRNPNAEPSLLAGIIRCAGCKRLMSPVKTHYRCKRYYGPNGNCQEGAYISKGIEEVVVRSVLAAYAERVRVTGREKRDDLVEAQARLLRADEELATFQRATEVADVGAEYFAEGLQQRVRAVEEARRAINQARSTQAASIGTGVVEAWEKLDVAERRHLLEAAFGQVWVRKGRGDWGRRVKLATTSEVLPSAGKNVPATPVDWDALDVQVRILAPEDSL